MIVEGFCFPLHGNESANYVILTYIEEDITLNKVIKQSFNNLSPILFLTLFFTKLYTTSKKMGHMRFITFVMWH